jgi:hypothetical protein
MTFRKYCLYVMLLKYDNTLNPENFSMRIIQETDNVEEVTTKSNCIRCVRKLRIATPVYIFLI